MPLMRPSRRPKPSAETQHVETAVRVVWELPLPFTPSAVACGWARRALTWADAQDRAGLFGGFPRQLRFRVPDLSLCYNNVLPLLRAL